MVVSVFDDDARLAIHLRELARDETDDPVFEVGCIIEEDRERGIDMFQGLLELSGSITLACLVQVLEFCEVLVCASLTREEPTEGREWSIHATGCVDTGSDLEPDQVCIALSDLVSSCEELAQTTRTRVLHLCEAECRDHAVLSYDRHTVRDGSERGEVDVTSENLRYMFTSYSYKYSVQQLKSYTSTSQIRERIE